MKLKRLGQLHCVEPTGGEPTGEPSGGGGGGGSIMSGGAGNEPAANEWDHIPEKHQVFNGEGDDKQFDLSASSKKMSEAYKSIESRVGNSELPPTDASGYKLDAEKMGEGFNAEEFMADEGTQSFLKSMHAKGVNNSQLQEIVEYGLNTWAPQLMEGNTALTEEACTGALQEVWKSEQEFKDGTGLAYKATKAFSSNDAEFDALMGKYGNDPDFIQFAARVGKEIQEDKGVDPQELLGNESIESLMASDAYKDDKHPDHKKVSDQISRYYAAKYPGEVAA